MKKKLLKSLPLITILVVLLIFTNSIFGQQQSGFQFQGFGNNSGMSGFSGSQGGSGGFSFGADKPASVAFDQNSTAKVKGSEVAVIGESFLAQSREICKNLEKSAKTDGIISQNDQFNDCSVSATQLYGGRVTPTIPDQYKNAKNKGKVKYVIMTGGGNDCLNGTSSAPFTANTTEIKNAFNAATTLIADMGKDGVKKVYWLRYPEPQQGMFGGGNLKPRLDVLMPLIQGLVEKSTSPKGYWFDLRPVYEGKYSQYIQSDGIHPTSAGCKATADALWKEIKANNFFETN